MAWYYLYDATTGELKSESSAPVVAPAGMAVLETAERRPDGTVWDTETRAWVAAPGPTRLPRGSFLLRFTPEEQAALDVAAGTRGTVASLFEKWVAYANAGEIDTQHPQLRALVQGLEAAGLIGPGRALEVLDG